MRTRKIPIFYLFTTILLLPKSSLRVMKELERQRERERKRESEKERERERERAGVLEGDRERKDEFSIFV